MKYSKKKIPLVILETLEPYINKNYDKAHIDRTNDKYLRLVDSETDSDFYFNIKEYKITNGRAQFLIEHKPKSYESIEIRDAWVYKEDLDKNISLWFKLLERYDKVETLFQNPIEIKYEEEFYNEFEIVDEDADKVSFNLNQQLFLDRYLGMVIEILEVHQRSDDNPEIQEIKEISIELKENLTTRTKKVVVKTLSRIWAKTRKHGLVLLKEVYIQARNELIKELIKAQLNS